MTMHVMQHRKMEETIEIPRGVEATIEGQRVIIKGKMGTVEKMLSSQYAELKKDNNKIVICAPSDIRKYKRVVYTFKAHILNMMHGVQDGYTYTLKVCAGHFPITVKVEGSHVIISNFLGEKIPRKSRILPNVSVKLDKDIITVQSADLEAAGQTAANLEQATGVGKRDRRVFQDGCYITEKPGRVFI